MLSGLWCKGRKRRSGKEINTASCCRTSMQLQPSMLAFGEDCSCSGRDFSSSLMKMQGCMLAELASFKMSAPAWYLHCKTLQTSSGQLACRLLLAKYHLADSNETFARRAGMLCSTWAMASWRYMLRMVSCEALQASAEMISPKASCLSSKHVYAQTSSFWPMLAAKAMHYCRGFAKHQQGLHTFAGPSCIIHKSDTACEISERRKPLLPAIFKCNKESLVFPKCQMICSQKKPCPGPDLPSQQPSWRLILEAERCHTALRSISSYRSIFFCHLSATP